MKHLYCMVGLDLTTTSVIDRCPQPSSPVLHHIRMPTHTHARTRTHDTRTHTPGIKICIIPAHTLAYGENLSGPIFAHAQSVYVYG